MLNKYLYSIFFLLFQGSLLFATEIQYTGKVISKNDKFPIANATILIKGKSIYSIANSNGFFSFKLDEAEIIEITVSHIGFIPKTIPIKPENSKNIIIELEEDILQMNEVVVTGTKTEKLIKDSPVLTRVISSKEIEKLNTGSFLSLLEAELPGIEFTSNANVPNINFQGLGGNYVLILIDGERIAGETRNNIDYEIINPNNIERIEIVKGSMSTLYGSNAIGGVINIITKKNNKAFHLQSTNRIGNFGEQQYSISGSSKIKNFSCLTSALWKTSDNYILKDRAFFKKIYSDSIITDNTLRTKEIEGGETLNLEQKIGYAFSKEFISEVKGNYLKRERFNAGTEGKVMHNFYYSYNITSKNNWKMDEKNLFELTYNFSKYDKVNYYRIINLEEKDYSNKLNNIKLASNHFLTEKQLLTCGIEYLNESLSTYMFSLGDVFDANSFTLYSQHEYKISDKLNLISGIRWDKHSNYGGNISPKVSVKYNLSKGISFRGTYATGYRSPSLKELHTNWDHLGMFQIVGNPNLSPEKSAFFSTSLDYSSNKMYASLNAFHNKIKDKLDLYWNATNDTVYYRNADKQIIKGLEAIVKVTPLKSLKIQMGYTFTDDGYKENGKNFSPTRPHSASLRIDYTLLSGSFKTFIGLNAKFLSKVNVYVEEEENVYYKIIYPEYYIWRFHVSEQIKDKISFSTGINNLFNYTAPVNSFYSPNTPGRTYFASLTVNIDSFFQKDEKQKKRS